MTLINHPLGGVDKNYNSRRSRQQLKNAYTELNSDKSFARIRKAAGLKRVASAFDRPTVAMIEVNKIVYVVNNAKQLFSIESDVVTLLGTASNGNVVTGLAATTNQVMVLTDLSGYLFDDTGFRNITDVDMVGGISLTSLNQIFWVAKKDSNVFYGSETSNADVWPSARQASAEEAPDNLVAIVSVKSALWLIGRETSEYWQTDINDPIVPVRKVLGATIEKGALNTECVTLFEDKIFFLASDGTVRVIAGPSLNKISDINLESAINGDSVIPGYVAPDNNVGFFIDDPIHKFYVLTFIKDKATWVFDLSTGLWHRRESFYDGEYQGFWRANQSVTIFEEDATTQTSLIRVIVGDLEISSNTGLSEFSYQEFAEIGNILQVEIITPPLANNQADLFLRSIELVMEVGVGNNDTPDPMLQIDYSKDGGASWLSRPNLPLGTVGNRQKRLRRFMNTRLKRNFNLVMRYRIAEAIEVVFYEQIFNVDQGTK